MTTSSQDMILTELVRKKKNLLDDLLVLSIRSVCNDLMEKTTLHHRSELLRMLELNDNAISQREKQTGLDARNQETALFSDIAFLLSSIRDNNAATLMKLEKTEKKFDAEKNELGLGKKLSSYVQQTRAMNSYRPRKQSVKNPKKRVKGTL